MRQAQNHPGMRTTMTVKKPLPGDLDPIETASRDEISACNCSACKWSLRHTYDNVAALSRSARQRRPPDDLNHAGRPRQVPLHDQDRPARQLPVRPVRRAARAGARACTRRAAPPASRSSSATRRTTSTTGPTWWRARSAPLAAAGDMVHVAYGYGMFTGGLGAHYGVERLGCTVVPMSGGQTESRCSRSWTSGRKSSWSHRPIRW
jgi:phenylacetate-CoA ligase